MLISVIPISIYALTMGCKKHKRYRLFLLGGAGLVLMVVAVLFGHYIGGELGEKTLTLLGAVLIVIAHFCNFRLCRKHNNCACSD
jgi:putative Ca2+/H+ antiporter (TMEM165/GDT1 family)